MLEVRYDMLKRRNIKYCLLRVRSALMKLDNPQSYLISTSEPQLILYVLYTDTHHKGLNEAKRFNDQRHKFLESN